MKSVRLRGGAVRDLESAADFYEEQEAGMGAWFSSMLLDEIEILGMIAGAHRKRHGLHCYVSDRFPYGVYYRVEGASAGVYAILDHRRNPRVIDRILRGR